MIILGLLILIGIGFAPLEIFGQNAASNSWGGISKGPESFNLHLGKLRIYILYFCGLSAFGYTLTTVSGSAFPDNWLEQQQMAASV